MSSVQLFISWVQLPIVFGEERKSHQREEATDEGQEFSLILVKGREVPTPAAGGEGILVRSIDRMPCQRTSLCFASCLFSRLFTILSSRSLRKKGRQRETPGGRAPEEF